MYVWGGLIQVWTLVYFAGGSNASVDACSFSGWKLAHFRGWTLAQIKGKNQ